MSEETDSYELQISHAFQEKLAQKLKNLLDLLLEYGFDSKDADLIVGNVIFLVPEESMDTSDIDIWIINYSKYIKFVYKSCLKEGYNIQSIVDIINFAPLSVEDEEDLERWADGFDENMEFLSFQLDMRNKVYANLKKLLDRDIVDKIIGELNVLIEPQIYNQNKKTIEQILNEYCLNIYKTYKMLKKYLDTDTRFINCAQFWQLFLLKPGEDADEIMESLN